jgi:hypothetical protein
MPTSFSHTPAVGQKSLYSNASAFWLSSRRQCSGFADTALERTSSSAGRRAMIFFEIPYEPGTTHTWYLDGLAEGRRSFDSRVEALSCAMRSAKAAQKSFGDTACIAIQGADGRWRTFDPDMLPLK